MVLVMCLLLFIGQGFSFGYCDLVTNLLQSAGYPSERHDVETADDYVITVNRIPAAVSKDNEIRAREPVILMHGFLGSAADYVVEGPGKGFSYILHDQGYDIWLPNARGTTSSKKHKKLSVHSSKYWNYSWHEIGIYDIAATVDYVLNKTSAAKVHYTGHSQGTTVLFVLLSERPEYNDKFASISLMSPIAYLGHLPSPLLRLYALNGNPERGQSLLQSFEIQELLPSSPLNTVLAAEIVCGKGAPLSDICLKLMYLAIGESAYPFNMTLLPEILKTVPAGVSLKQFRHFTQLVVSGKFRKFDFRSEVGNFKAYGRTRPPEYNFKNVKAPLFMLYADRDLLLAKQDVLLLKSALKHNKSRYLLIRGFNHVDFLYSTEAPRLCYSKIISHMKKSTLDSQLNETSV